MAAVGARDTAPEMAVRSILHGLGLRFRLHDRTLPGIPDIVLRKHRTVVFVHGCFWHRHACGRGVVPATRVEYWGLKLQKNVDRDQANSKTLRRLGWRVIVVWECELKRVDALRRRLARLFAAAMRPKSGDKSTLDDCCNAQNGHRSDSVRSLSKQVTRP